MNDFLNHNKDIKEMAHLFLKVQRTLLFPREYLGYDAGLPVNSQNLEILELDHYDLLSLHKN